MTRAALVLAPLTLLFVLTLAHPVSVGAQSASDIQKQIDANNAQIAQIQADIAAFQKQLNQLGAQKNTLQSTISKLGIEAKQLASQIKLTENKIAAANLQIEKLSLSIGDKEQKIGTNQVAIGSALQSMAEGEQQPLIAQLITADSLGDAWQAADETIQFNRALQDAITNLKNAKVELSNNRDQVSAEKAKLIALNRELTTQKRSVDANTAAQKQLLAQTKNQESNYQKLLAQKKAAQKSFENELIKLQDQLNLIVNPSSLPKVGRGILSWPFTISFMNGCATRSGVFGNAYCITQYFGNTPFSTANPQIYNGHGHNAIDIAAPIGTPVVAALSGTVVGTGNTDLVSGCYSFGKWVMVQHNNGVNTMYSHLSVIDVSKGQTVSTGQTVGLAGMTGYATGPHLHFGVYATEGTKIMTLRQFRGATIGCADATMPVATLDAYLNPLSYL
jgi:murein DD-endopeptidase MepM/ murein hydrolase activator NlpD